MHVLIARYESCIFLLRLGEQRMSKTITMSIRVPDPVRRRIDLEIHRRRMADTKGRAVSRTAIVLEALETALTPVEKGTTQ
jgi:hypothetical protein